MSNVIKIIIWLLMIVGGLFLSLYLDANLLNVKVEHSGWLYNIVLALGVFLLVMMINFNKSIGRFLKKNGREGNLPRLQTNVLVKHGPYALMRHPMHLSLLLFPVSVALISFSPSFIFIVAPIEIIFILIMIKLVEEPDARNKFGKEYDEYIKGLPWFCFKISCLKAILNADRDLEK